MKVAISLVWRAAGAAHIASAFARMSRRVLMWACCVGMLACAQGIVAGSAAAWELPEGRVYEMVSPPYKAGQEVIHGNPVEAAPDGEAAEFLSPGVFAGSPAALPVLNGYLSRRDLGGWGTSPLDPPATLAAGRLFAPEDVSSDVARSVTLLTFAPNATTRVQSTEAFYLREPNGAFVEASPRLQALNSGERFPDVIYRGASADLSHLIFSVQQPLLLSDIQVEGNRLYEVTDTSGASPSLRLVGVNGKDEVIDPACKVGLGSLEARGSAFHAVSEDGSEVFFSSCSELYVRVNGSETVQISPSAFFQGASSDGSRVFFTQGSNLYEDEVKKGSVTELTQVLMAEGVQGGTRISDDGSHVYFVASGALTSQANGLEQKAVAGADNLYVYDTVTHETKFVAELCSGKEESGSVTGVGQCPGVGSDTPLWRTSDSVRPAQSTPGGRFLVFDTYGQLIGSGPEADTDTALDVYRYDSQTGDLVRVSVREDGHDSNGNGNTDATISVPQFREGEVSTQYELSTRAVDEDGSTIVFSTEELLSVRAINGQPDIYEWHEGHVGLISDGHSATPDEAPVISLSGRDIFFETSEGLVPQDTDGVTDVYDARIDGGFPVAPVPASGCSGSSCQGPPSVPSLLGAPASATFSGLGNPTPPASTLALTRAQKLKAALRVCEKKRQIKKRMSCEAQAKKRYGAKQWAKGSGSSTKGKR
jgi:hypothetical protein